MDKRCLSVNSVNEILGKLYGEKQLLYDKAYIENLYIEYQNHIINDDAAVQMLDDILADRKILVLGSGASVKTRLSKIKDYIKLNNPIVIAINFIPDGIEPDYVFLSNSKRYVGLASKLARIRQPIIATSNVTPHGKSDFECVLNYNSLIDRSAEIIDNSLIMLLKMLIRLGKKSVTLAGCDGYSARRTNYYNTGMEYDFIKDKASYLNGYTKNFISQNADKLCIKF